MPSLFRNVAAILVVMALAVRVLVPAGWMPSTENAFALTMCAGADTHTVWLTKDGKLHKEDPSKGKGASHAPCAFASASAVADVPTDAAVALSAPQTNVPSITRYQLRVGQGLAAPPPRATGPPILV